MTTVQTHEAWVPTDTFANRLVLVRRERGLTTEQAAQICGLRTPTWGGWEQGAYPRNMLAVVSAISRGLGVSREWLMWGGALRSPEPDGPDDVSLLPRRDSNTQPAGCVDQWLRLVISEDDRLVA